MFIPRVEAWGLQLRVLDKQIVFAKIVVIDFILRLKQSKFSILYSKINTTIDNFICSCVNLLKLLNLNKIYIIIC